MHGQTLPRIARHASILRPLILILLLGGMAFLGIGCRERRSGASRQSCCAGLKQIEGAIAAWAFENEKKSNDVVTFADLVGPTNYIRDMPLCPGHGIFNVTVAG